MSVASGLIPTPASSAAPQPTGADADAARRRLYLSMWFFIAGALVGAPWDRLWHWTQLFDAFASPPHVFMYSMAGMAGAAAISIQFSARLRRCLGPGVHFPGLKEEVPYPLSMVGAGLVCLGLAGVLDSAWHGAFGLDETSWSTPHAVLWWGFFLAALGYLACRLALRPLCPLSPAGTAVFGSLVLATAMTVTLGPFAHNSSPETVRAISAIPTIAAEAPLQHMYRIYLSWNLTQSNAVFPALAALAAGFGFALVRGFVKRPRDFLVVVLLVTSLTFSYAFAVARVLGALGNPANWLPVPILPAAAVLLFLQRKAVPEPAALGAAGLTLGLLSALVWNLSGPGLVFGLAAGPALVAGSVVGRGLWAVSEGPTRRGLSVVIPLLGLGLPVLTGTLDLYLRLHTP